MESQSDHEDAPPLSIFERLWRISDAATSEPLANLFIDVGVFDPDARRLQLDRVDVALNRILSTEAGQTSIRIVPDALIEDAALDDAVVDALSDEKREEALRFVAASLLRLAATAPHSDVASFASQFCDNFRPISRFVHPATTSIQEVNDGIDDSSLRREVSAFIPLSALPSLGDRQVSSLFTSRFSLDGRLDNYSRVIAAHPTYLEAHARLEEELTGGEGIPLVASLAHYLAILATSAQDCPYFVSTQSQRFLLRRGDPEWLKGLASSSAKVKAIDGLNQLLSRRPWALEGSHVAALVRGPAGSSWSLPEVVHAVAILAQFHGAASLALACGVAIEIDDLFAHDAEKRGNDRGNDFHNSAVASAPGLDIKRVIDKMEKIQSSTDEISQEQKAKIFDKMTGEEIVSGNDGGSASSMPESPAPGTPKKPVDEFFGGSGGGGSGGGLDGRRSHRFLIEPRQRFIEFASTRRRPSNKSLAPPSPAAGASPKTPPRQKFEPLTMQDFSWADHGYSFMSRFCDLSHLFDEKFRVAQTLTYFTMGSHDEIDTSPFRIAIWNYVHLLFGIRHDDYDYTEIAILLDLPLRKFVKVSACQPSKVTKELFEASTKNLKDSEKIHVAIMVAEAKTQAELLYGLKAVHEYFIGDDFRPDNDVGGGVD